MRTLKPRLRRSAGRHHVVAWIFSCLALVLVSGCALLGRGTEDDPFAGRRLEGPMWIEIQNDHFNDARIYAHWGGQRHRIGMVVGKSFQTVETEWRSEEFRLEVDLIAGRGFVTEALVVWPGDTVYLQIPSVLTGNYP